MEKLNTHYYDTHLKNIYKELCNLQNTNSNYLSNTITNETLFRELNESLDALDTTHISKDTIRKMLQLVQNDNYGNYDSANDIETLDILSRTWFYVKKLPLEDRKILFEQLGEIQNGTCSQGRTTRIFQIYYSFF
jgi:hypothetical protein